MAEYTCNVCRKIFYEGEKNLTNDEHKCILHCEKENNFTSSNQIDYFINYIEKILIDSNFHRFKFVIFPDISMKYLQFQCELEFDDCKFYGKMNRLENINYFDECIFYKSVELVDSKKSNVALFKNCIFHSTILFNQAEYLQTIFEDCTFKEKTKLYSSESTFKEKLFLNNKNLPSTIEIIDSRFDKELDIKNTCRELSIDIEDCIFNDEFNIWGCENINRTFMLRCKFNLSLNIANNSILDLNISQFLIKEASSFENNKINKLFCRNITFHNFVSFRNSCFDFDLDLTTIHFKKKVSFNDSVVKGELNLRDTIFDDDANFIDISKDNTKLITVDVKNRETARKIKDSFEKQNNIIESNKYYALEMKEREKELEITKKDNWLEWLVFKIHGITSNHSQDWLLALFWIFYIGFTASIFDFYMMQDIELKYIHYNFDKLKITSIISLVTIFTAYTLTYRNTLFHTVILIGFYLIYMFTFKDMTLNHFANIVNPFSIMTKGDTLTFSMLSFKVIIAYLMYQFVVSIRQNTRRK